MASGCLSVRPSVQIEKLCSKWTDFIEISCLNIFLKSADKIKVSLKYDNFNGTLHEDQYTFLIISRTFLCRMRNFSDKICRENQYIHLIFNNFFFFNLSFPDITWKILHSLAGHKWQYCTCALHAGYKHTPRICNVYCFSTATVFAGTHLNVSFVHCRLVTYVIILIISLQHVSASAEPSFVW